MASELNYKRICPDCTEKMMVLLKARHFSDYIWYCDGCKLIVWQDMIVQMDRVKKYLED